MAHDDTASTAPNPSTTEVDEPAMTAPRPTDRMALVTGFVFTIIGAAYLADEVGAFAVEARWVWPVLLIGLGFAGLVSGARRA
ncbi:MAG TPA: hypothetical protein VGA13_06075 [Acidimicrobiales bacterium]